MKKEKKKKLYLHVFLDRVVVGILILLQLLVITLALVFTSDASVYISYALKVISALVALWVVTENSKPEFKLLWIILILVFPVGGGLFYLIFSIRLYSSVLRPLKAKVDALTEVEDFDGEEMEREAICKHARCRRTIIYTKESAGFPIYRDEGTRYYGMGEDFFPQLLEDLSRAKRYIFLEYFIVAEGEMWGRILEVLERKAAAGVEVRVIYDDLGCVALLPKRYDRTLEEKNIKCRVFNRFRPLLTGIQNNRDHRKICVIDGEVAYTGGINLSDEYIGVVERYGRWKDCAVRVCGGAAWGFTLIFLKMWLALDGAGGFGDVSAFMPTRLLDAQRQECEGFVQPYSDSPLDDDRVSEDIYMQIIGSAQRYVYIYTPYLIVGSDMMSALMVAARSGVDVRIITPHKWDKKFVHMTTRSAYRTLIESGVKIYEYTPGFVHSKVMISDGEIAVVGTANLDYRSLYLHFECGVVLYGGEVVCEIERDFLKTQGVCARVREEDPACRGGVCRRFVNAILRLIAPML